MNKIPTTLNSHSVNSPGLTPLLSGRDAPTAKVAIPSDEVVKTAQSASRIGPVENANGRFMPNSEVVNASAGPEVAKVKALLQDALTPKGRASFKEVLQGTWDLSEAKAEHWCDELWLALASDDPRQVIRFFPKPRYGDLGSSSQPVAGAYEGVTKSIWLDEALSEEAKVLVYLEELAHHWETIFGLPDERGDEGELFRRLFMGPPLSPVELERLNVEKDERIVTLNGIETRVECASHWPSFPADTQELGTWVHQCISKDLYRYRSLNGRTLLEELRARGEEELIEQLETGLMEEVFRSIENGLLSHLGAVSSVQRSENNAAAYDRVIEKMADLCVVQGAYYKTDEDGLNVLDTLMSMVEPERQGVLRSQYTEVFLKQLQETQTVGFEQFARWGDFNATHPDTGETVFETVDWFDNFRVYHELSRSLARTVEAQLDAGTLPANMDVYFEKSLYDVTSDEKTGETKMARWLGALSELSDSDKGWLAKALTGAAMVTMARGSESYLELAMKLGDLTVTSEHGSNLFDVVKNHGLAATYSLMQDKLAERVHHELIEGNGRLTELAGEHANYLWRSPAGRTLMASLCGHTDNRHYESLQQSLLKRFADNAGTRAPDLSGEFLRYGNYRGQKPAALVRYYGTPAMNKAVDAALPGAAKKLLNGLLEDQVGRELTPELQATVLERALSPLMAMMRHERFESEVLSEVDEIIIHEQVRVACEEFSGEFGYAPGPKERAWYRDLYLFGGTLADLRQAFLEARGALRKRVIEKAGSRVKAHHLNRVVQELMANPEIKTFIGAFVKHRALARKVQPSFVETPHTVALSEVISDLAQGEDLEATLRSMTQSQGDIFETLTSEWSREDWTLLHGKTRQFFDLALPEVGDEDISGHPKNTLTLEALTKERAERVTKMSLLRKEIGEKLSAFFVVERAGEEVKRTELRTESGRLVFATRGGIDGIVNKGERVLPLHGKVVSLSRAPVTLGVSRDLSRGDIKDRSHLNTHVKVSSVAVRRIEEVNGGYRTSIARNATRRLRVGGVSASWKPGFPVMSEGGGDSITRFHKNSALSERLNGLQNGSSGVGGESQEDLFKTDETRAADTFLTVVTDIVEELPGGDGVAKLIKNNQKNIIGFMKVADKSEHVDKVNREFKSAEKEAFKVVGDPTSSPEKVKEVLRDLKLKADQIKKTYNALSRLPKKESVTPPSEPGGIFSELKNKFNQFMKKISDPINTEEKFRKVEADMTAGIKSQYEMAMKDANRTVKKLEREAAKSESDEGTPNSDDPYQREPTDPYYNDFGDVDDSGDDNPNDYGEEGGFNESNTDGDIDNHIEKNADMSESKIEAEEEARRKKEAERKKKEEEDRTDDDEDWDTGPDWNFGGG